MKIFRLPLRSDIALDGPLGSFSPEFSSLGDLAFSLLLSLVRLRALPQGRTSSLTTGPSMDFPPPGGEGSYSEGHTPHLEVSIIYLSLIPLPFRFRIIEL